MPWLCSGERRRRTGWCCCFGTVLRPQHVYPAHTECRVSTGRKTTRHAIPAWCICCYFGALFIRTSRALAPSQGGLIGRRREGCSALGGEAVGVGLPCAADGCRRMNRCAIISCSYTRGAVLQVAIKLASLLLLP
jgi:hypothetical protein